MSSCYKPVGSDGVFCYSQFSYVYKYLDLPIHDTKVLEYVMCSTEIIHIAARNQN